MNECTIHGNATDEPVRHQSPSGRVAVSFDIAVNNGYFDRNRAEYVNQSPVFHHVVCFDDLAENVAATVHKGMAVTVTGRFRDNSYTNAENRLVRRVQLNAADVAVSLRWASATLVRRTAEDAAGQPAADSPRIQAVPAA